MRAATHISSHRGPLRGLILGLVFCVHCAGAIAQAYPTKPIRIVVAYPTGGATDLMARYACEWLAKTMGQPCIVENKPGSLGIAGTDTVAKATPDGHALIMVPSSLMVVPAMFSKLPFDVLRDLAPIALVSTTPVMIGAHPEFPAKSLKELIAYAKANPGKVDFTSCDPTSQMRLAGEMLNSLAGISMVHVPYKGCGQALPDVIAGRVPVFISTVAHFAPQIKAGKLRGYAVMSPERTRFAPEFPAVADSGFPGFAVDIWFGLLAPAGTPSRVIAKLSEAINMMLADAGLREKFQTQSYESIGGSPEKFAEVLRTDVERYGKVIRQLGLKGD